MSNNKKIGAVALQTSLQMTRSLQTSCLTHLNPWFITGFADGESSFSGISFPKVNLKGLARIKHFSTTTKYGNSIPNPFNNMDSVPIAIPVVTYSNAAADKSRILAENKKKSGIYV